ncbi:hypothetical protein H0H92_007221 [Tricholoma furcatifolium]|nr:hypothetical protein H0H92_007221 [Tricholoma furcatifolium]
MWTRYFEQILLAAFLGDAAALNCRNIPGSSGYPTDTQWAALNASISGRLVSVVPSAKYCEELPSGSCTDAQWTSAVFRSDIPGAMNQVNFESDWDSNPPSLCLRNSTTCEQGNTPSLAVLAESASDIQTGVKFAKDFNLRLAIKASGHDYLGRSTAKSSLLISTHKLKNITFSDNFMVGGEDKGSTITVGSGVTLSEIYAASGVVGKIVVGGTAATVVAAGGYVQGAGHSALSPLLGLASDNCLQLEVVLANGVLVTANAEENSDLFWAMRGGGAGSWGVIVSATFQTFPTFDAAVSTVGIFAPSFDIMGKVVTAHAQHIFDWDSLHAGQYFWLYAQYNLSLGDTYIIGSAMAVITYFPGASTAAATAAMKPFLNDVQQLGANTTSSVTVANINEALYSSDDSVGEDVVLGSRLIDADVYRTNPALVGQTYVDLLNAGVADILGHLVAGGKVSQNANVSSAVNPKWRTAKTHLIISNQWLDSTPVSDVRTIENTFRDMQLPILQQIAPPGAGSYTNEADAREVEFETTFYGPNYAKLTAIKAKYDPTDLFIVAAGVGSERWDAYGLCRV